MSATESIHREDDLEFRIQVVALGPSQFNAFFQVFRRTPGAAHPVPLMERRHAAHVECASAVTAESLALRAARKAAFEALGRAPTVIRGAHESSWIGKARGNQIGTAFSSVIPLD